MTTATRVLVIDDEAPVRLSLAAFLEDRGLEVSSAESAEEAVRRLEEAPVDVVIVDMRLPGMDGNALILAARRLNPSIRFIIYTGSTSYQLPPALAELGITGSQVFHKPLPDMAILADAIAQLKESTEEEKRA